MTDFERETRADSGLTDRPKAVWLAKIAFTFGRGLRLVNPLRKEKKENDDTQRDQANI